MEDNKPESTEVKGHVLSVDEVSDWGNNTVIIEPGVNDEHGNEVREAPKDDEVEEEKAGDEADGIEEEHEEPAPVVTVEDPGTYEPNDYSFDVTIFDDEGNNPKSVKISTIDEFEELLEKDPNFGSPSKLLKAQRLATKMESKSEADKADYDKKLEAYTKQNETAQAQQEQVNTIAAEISYLVGKGKLPAVEKKYETADWSDPEVAKQPGVKEQVELLNYMRKENDTRVKAGLKPLTSVLDAYNALQLENRDKKATSVKKQAAEARQSAGARVAGNSPAPVSNAPKGVSVGRGGTLRDLDPGW